ncbi:UDP-3-O-[3-hydroxymyristoyl] N-acetylglucosamine deacetylase [bacterium]|nr:MAG: UDP-3-O-[3-hydroxymyristoyl] N-acetylglucosamine deacetylase [bacterium]
MQRITLKDAVRFSGFGLFSAEPISLTIAPSKTQSGLVFKHKNTIIAAHINNLSSLLVHPAFAKMSPRCTSIHNQQINIATIEHVLSALTGLGITDALIEIDSKNAQCEIPILDGSSLEFVNAIQAVGTLELDSTVEPITLTKIIHIEDGDSSITLEPADAASYSYTLDYTDAAIANATVTWEGDANDYAKRISIARTFCLEHEADAMQSAGMFGHLSTKDMLVLGEAGPINNTLRHKHECALHKLLDLIGDLTLVGQPLRAKVVAIKSGHAMAHRAARSIVEQNQH